MRTYFPHDIEKKWQKKWEDEKSWQTPSKPNRPKWYCLDMFPYPSGAGLHVGHPLGYIASDIASRYRRRTGYDVLHPMGWDAFGLPAENFAIKHGIHPTKSTQDNIKNFTRQIKSFGFTYDWSREINTSDPKYYRWTQWIFLQMYKHGLAYRKEAAVNWCPSCQTVLANEQVIEGACERCHTKVEQRNLKQWFLRITKYAEELLLGLENLKWSDRLKTIQRNWIGRKQGLLMTHKIKNTDLEVTTFTAYPAWVFADTFIVMAPEHPLLPKLIIGTKEESAVQAVIDRMKKRSTAAADLDTMEKEGCFTGRFAVDPLTGDDMPIWVANFALMDFGTGSIRCSAHDVRDREFAEKYHIPLREVVDRTDASEPINAHDQKGVLKNSGEFNGLSVSEAEEKICVWMEKQGFAKKHTTYRLRDWLISRQRYWGAPIPIVYCDDCGEQPVSENDLPIKLPTDVDFKPTGESPLSHSKTFHAVACPKCEKPARRESDTMDTFVCSSWYFLRFTDPNNDQVFANAENLKNWLPVDLYIGGIEHAVLHLLYARFFTKALRDFGYLNFDEPFLELKNQGLILGPDNQKMSKSRGNVVNPDEVIEAYGADAFRLYEMFMGPFEDVKPWSIAGIKGVSRFLGRVYGLLERLEEHTKDDDKLFSLTQKTIVKVTNDIETFHFNTAISTLMILNNECEKRKTISRHVYETLVMLLEPFAPHIAEELWQQLGHHTELWRTGWPKQKENIQTKEDIVIVIQINGKVRGKVLVSPEEVSQEALQKRAEQLPAIAQQLQGKSILRVIHVKNKLLNFVVTS